MGEGRVEGVDLLKGLYIKCHLKEPEPYCWGMDLEGDETKWRERDNREVSQLIILFIFPLVATKISLWSFCFGIKEIQISMDATTEAVKHAKKRRIH